MIEEMGQIIMRNWDLREFRVPVNLPSLIRQVRVPIRRVITPIQCLPNPIRQVVPLISHIRSYPPHRSHLHPPYLSFSSTSQPSSQNTKLSISNYSSFRQKHLGVPDGSDGSDGTSYPLMENYTLPVALHTYSFTLWSRLRAIRRTRVLHSSQGLQLCSSRLHNAWQC